MNHPHPGADEPLGTAILEHRPDRTPVLIAALSALTLIIVCVTAIIAVLVLTAPDAPTGPLASGEREIALTPNLKLRTRCIGANLYLYDRDSVVGFSPYDAECPTRVQPQYPGDSHPTPGPTPEPSRPNSVPRPSPSQPAGTAPDEPGRVGPEPLPTDEP